MEKHHRMAAMFIGSSTGIASQLLQTGCSAGGMVLSSAAWCLGGKQGLADVVSAPGDKLCAWAGLWHQLEAAPSKWGGLELRAPGCGGEEPSSGWLGHGSLVAG